MKTLCVNWKRGTAVCASYTWTSDLKWWRIKFKSFIKPIDIYILKSLSNGHGHHALMGGGADKSLARPGRKQATATKLGIYSTYSPLSTIHFLDRYSNFFKPLKKHSECCPSNQVSTAAMTYPSDEKWRAFNCFFGLGNGW